MTKNELNKLDIAAKNYLCTIQNVQAGNYDYNYGYRCIQNHLTTSLCNTKGYWTGLVSEAALALPKSKRTKEHAYGMTNLAKDLLAINNPTVDKIKAEILSEKSKYNLTTAKENMILRNNDQNYDMISKLVIE